MACEKRQNTGHCGHYQCPFSTGTEHGAECVDFFDGLCEVGLDCLVECQHSYKQLPYGITTDESLDVCAVCNVQMGEAHLIGPHRRPEAEEETNA